jgi:uncharacterized protein YyaL (SSP411 family)
MALATFAREKLWDAQHKMLYKAIGDNGAIGSGALEDYAFLAEGLYALWQLDKDTQVKTFLQDVLAQAWQRFYDKQGWQLAQNTLLKYDNGKTMISDGPMPSPSSLLIKTSYQYGKDVDDAELKTLALRALNVGHADMQGDPFWYASQIDALRVVRSE